MIEPGWKVYRGMIIGEHTSGNDLEVNVLKGKKLTNIRTHSKDEAVRLIPPIQMTLEKALAYIGDDELVEVTPKAIRLRKKLLDPNDRKLRKPDLEAAMRRLFVSGKIRVEPYGRPSRQYTKIVTVASEGRNADNPTCPLTRRQEEVNGEPRTGESHEP